MRQHPLHAEIKALLAAGESNAAIGRTLHIDYGIVAHIRRGLGMSRTNDPVTTDDVTALRRRGLTIQQIADRLGYSTRTVHRALRRTQEGRAS